MLDIAWSTDEAVLGVLGIDAHLSQDIEVGITKFWNAETRQFEVETSYYFTAPTPDIEWTFESGQFIVAGGSIPVGDRFSAGYVSVNSISSSTGVHSWETSGRPEFVDWTGSTNLIAFDDLGKIVVLSSQTVDLVYRFDTPIAASSAEWNRAGTTLALTNHNGLLQFVDVTRQEVLREYQAAHAPVALDWGIDDSVLITLSSEGIIELWDTSDLDCDSQEPTATPSVRPTLPGSTPSATDLPLLPR